MSASDSEHRPGVPRGAQLALAVVFSAAVVGYFVGLGGSREAGPAPWQPERSAGSPATRAGATDGGAGASGANEHAPPPVGDLAIPATAYCDMRAAQLGPNRNWPGGLSALVQPETDLFAQADQRRKDPAALEQAKREALADRATRRAYNGAPPVIPHRIDDATPSNCLACHQTGLFIADTAEGRIRASRIPHALMGNCVQCHVEAHGSAPTGADGLSVVLITVANRFEGLPAPLAGERAWPGAPPTVPHSTLMRTDCLACHGVAGPLGMRSTHPWRSSCLQCHAPSSILDQVPAGTPIAALAAPTRPAMNVR